MGLKQVPHEFHFVNNTVINGGPSVAQFICIKQGSDPVKILNNIFAGPEGLPHGSGALENYLVTDKSIFLVPERYDYRLKTGTKAINAGIYPGELNGLNLQPTFQIVHPMQAKTRKSDGALDLGAFEY